MSFSDSNDLGVFDGTSPEGAKDDPKKRRRNRKPVTCAQCRKRKLKCDRGAPCGACKERNEGHLCEWEGAIRLPPSNYTRDQEASDLRNQLDRLESLLGLLSSSTPQVEQDPLEALVGGSSVLSHGTFREADAEKTSAAEALGLLAAPAKGTGIGVFNSPNLLATAPPGHSIDQIISILPQRVELEVFVNQFLAEEIETLPIFHAESFRDRCRRFDRSLARDDPFFIALLLAISGWITYWRTTDPRGAKTAAVKEGTVKTYLSLAMEALHLGRFMESPTLDALRALLILHHYWTQQDSPSSSYILATCIQMAQNMGLDRDPAAFARFTYLEVEERRRLWTLLVCYDWTSNAGRSFACHPAQYDTLLPANALDEDVAERGVIARPLHNSTSLTELLFKAQIAATARIITERAFGIRLVPSWSVVLELNDQLGRIDTSLPPCLAFDWVNGAVKPIPENAAMLDFTRVNVHLLLRRQFIRLHRPFLSRGLADTRFNFSREKCCWAARYVLAIHRGLGEDYRAARFYPLVFHTMNALCVLAVDIWQDPSGSHAEYHRADVAASLKILEARTVKSKLVLESIRVVGTLLRRAFTTDNLKRTHDEMAAGPVAGFPSPELLSFGAGTIAAGDSLNRPFDANAPFSIPLPIPMSVESFATVSAVPGVDAELVNLWSTLAKRRTFYGLPDHREWLELCRGVRGRAWSGGIDLLQ